jgi:uncharacterized membrane protein YjgN (DUF898 family)
MSVVDAASAPPSGPPRITWTHPPGGLLGLSLVNGLLRVLTLGVYHFWGKTEARQRIWAAVRIDGEPLEYRGTGGELFRGFLIVFALVLLPLSLIGFLPLLVGTNLWGNLAFQIAVFVLILGFGGLAMFRARRYRLSRTRWRGIRGGLSGSSTPFAWTYFWSTLLIPVTLGWIIPWRAARLQRDLFNETRFGDRAFTFEGRSGPLYRRFWLVWVSAIVLYVVASSAAAAVYIAPLMKNRQQPDVPLPPPTLGQAAILVAIGLGALLIFAMIRAWYSSRMFNYFASETRYHGCRFRLATTVPSLVWLVATNYLMRLLSLGVLSPVAEARTMRYIIERLSIEGTVDWPAVGQNPDALMARGEGLAEAFDVDAF